MDDWHPVKAEIIRSGSLELLPAQGRPFRIKRQHKQQGESVEGEQQVKPGAWAA